MTTPTHVLGEKTLLTGAAGPIAFPDDIIVFAIGDVHGQRDAFKRAIKLCARVALPGKRRVLVLTGDLNDRGPDSFGCLQLVADVIEQGLFDAVIYLPGNHEQLLLNALNALRAGDYSNNQLVTWARNGGLAMMEELGTDWVKAPHAQNLAGILAKLPRINGLPFEQAILAAPSHARFGDVVFVHGGLNPSIPMDSHLAQPHLLASENHWAWIRRPFLYNTGGCRDENGKPVLVVHGHSIAPTSATNWVQHPDKMREGMVHTDTYGRICIDGGAANAEHVAGVIIADGAYRTFAVPC